MDDDEWWFVTYLRTQVYFRGLLLLIGGQFIG